MIMAVAVVACVPMDEGDPQESDPTNLGITEQGIVVGTGATTTSGVIYSGGDLYRHEIDLLYGGTCVFETALGTMPDTIMWLRDQNLNQLAYDDDSGPGYASRIVQGLIPGRYYIDIKGYSTYYTGSWDLTVSCTDAVMFHENFVANGDAGQCGGRTGAQLAAMGTWTQNVFINADDRSGWCEQQFGITDPTGAVSGLSLAVNFYASGNAGQCVGSGYRGIPVSGSTSPQWSSAYGINTDGRSGGCWQVFYLSGRSDVALDVEFLAAGDAGQCGNTGTYVVTSQNAASFHIDTDNRSGGCTQRFRLRRL